MGDNPVIVAIILAAGRSTRMGAVNKLLVDFNGMALVERTLAQVRAAGFEKIYVVTGHEAEKVRKVLEGPGVEFVHNEYFADGLSTSINAGIGALGQEVEGVLIALGDMPMIHAMDLQVFRGAFTGPSDICAPVWKGERGNPVLWGRAYFAALKLLDGDKGARDLLQKHADHVIKVQMTDAGVLQDVDTPDDLLVLQGEKIS